MILGLRHIEGILEIGGEVVITGVISGTSRITDIVVLIITPVAVVTNHTFGGAEASSSFTVTSLSMTIAPTRPTGAPIDGITVVTSYTPVATRALSIVLTRLNAYATICLTVAMPVALACWT